MSAEQVKYQEHAKATMIDNPSAYSIVNPGVATYVAELWNVMLHRNFYIFIWIFITGFFFNF